MKSIRRITGSLANLLLLLLSTVKASSSSPFSVHSSTVGALRGGQSGAPAKTAPGVRWGRTATPVSPGQRPSSSTAWREMEDPGRKSQSDKEIAKEMMDAFLTRDSRQTFIARVYAILAGQLLVTMASIFLFQINPSVVTSILGRTGMLVPWVSLALSTWAWLWMASSVRARREAPLKWRLLGMFTLAESFFVGLIAAMYKFKTVILAMGATAAATGAVSLYTIVQRNSKYDLSQWGQTLASAGMIFVVYGLVHMLELMGILPKGFLPYRETLFCLAGAVLFSAYLAYHTKLVVAGKHSKYQLNEKDYVFGAMLLYNDVINIFIYILRILGEDRQ